MGPIKGLMEVDARQRAEDATRAMPTQAGPALLLDSVGLIEV